MKTLSFFLTTCACASALAAQSLEERRPLSTLAGAEPSKTAAHTTQDKSHELLAQLTNLMRQRPAHNKPGALQFAPPKEAMEIASFLTLLKKHRGDMQALQNDPEMQKIAPHIGARLHELQEAGQQIHMGLRFAAPLINQMADTLVKNLEDPAYAPLLKTVAPTLKDIISLGKSMLGKIEVLGKELSQIDRHSGLAALISSRAAERTIPTQQSPFPERTGMGRGAELPRMYLPPIKSR